MTTALIDGDTFAYRCAISAEGDSVEVAISRVDRWLRETLHEIRTEEYKLFIGGEDNFRYRLYSGYKSSRKDKPRPRFLADTKQFLVDEWKAVVANGHEADDELGIHTTEDTIIVSNDKDLYQIPTSFYNPVTKDYTFIPPSESRYLFNLQLMMGDKSDDIPGYDGVSRAKPPKFIEKMLAYMRDPDEEIFDLYHDKAQYLINYNLLHIWRKPSDLQIPEILIGRGLCVPEGDLTCDSLLSIMPLINQLSGPTDPETDGY